MIDKMFGALADDSRRQLLVDLLDHNPRRIAKPSVDPQESGTVDTELIRMTHFHLPKLADYGFIEWDREEEPVDAIGDQ